MVLVLRRRVPVLLEYRGDRLAWVVDSLGKYVTYSVPAERDLPRD